VLPRKTRSGKQAKADAVRNADDAEILALIAGPGVDTPLDDALLDDRVSEALVEATAPADDDAEPSTTAIDDAMEKDEYTEGLLALASEVITARQQLLGDAYPFELFDNGLRYKGSKTLVYEFCLAIGGVSNIAATKYKPAITVFEQLSGLVMSCFIGAPGQYYHTGFPGSEAVITGHLPRLNAQMPGEWRWDAETVKQKPNDGGVDVIVWKRPDGRASIGASLMFVGNAGCGRLWYPDNKHLRRPSEELEKILSRPKRYHLHDFFALPFHLFDLNEWIEASDDGRFVLDRIRLARIAESQDVGAWTNEAARLRLSLAAAIRLLNPDVKFVPGDATSSAV
jgi:hypothetical protein